VFGNEPKRTREKPQTIKREKISEVTIMKKTALLTLTVVILGGALIVATPMASQARSHFSLSLGGPVYGPVGYGYGYGYAPVSVYRPGYVYDPYYGAYPAYPLYHGSYGPAWRIHYHR
jgi:hypothetical protein